MTEKVYVNADRTKVVSAYSAEAAMQIHRSEAVRLGLVDTEEKPKQVRRTTEDAPKPQKRRKSE
jgi:hypothetical protein